MNFTATAVIKEIEKLNDKFFKILLEDERRQHIVVTVPVEKEKELAIGIKVSIWGNVSAFNYQSKWYNNLFAQTVVPEEKKYLLIKKTEEDGKQFFRQIQFGSEPFTLEFVKSNFPSDFKVEKENESLPEKIEGTIEEPMTNKTDEVKGLSLLQRLLSKKSSSTEAQSSGFFNLEYWHLQNAVTHKKVQIQKDCIFTNENFSFFSKPQGLVKLPFLYFYEQGEVVEIKGSDL
jgi:hypothetical protein